MGLGRAGRVRSSEMKHRGLQFRSAALVLPVGSQFVLVRCGLNDLKLHKLEMTINARIIHLF